MPRKYYQQLCYNLYYITTIMSLLPILELYPTSNDSFIIYIWKTVLYNKKKKTVSNIYVGITVSLPKLSYLNLGKE